MTIKLRDEALLMATHRQRDELALRSENYKISEIFGENVFDLTIASGISDEVRASVIERINTGKPISKEDGEHVARVVTEWAISKGATHFCHWFQPMTGSTAEKHDSFLVFDKQGWPIEKLGAKQLMHGEPDASSFPNGGARSTFEARGYTTWDISSPLFLLEGEFGKTLCIPTAFVTYHGDALDIKTPLLRSISALNKQATKLQQLLGRSEVQSIEVNLGVEQEYFLIDKSLYFARPDLVMTGRTLFGPLTPKNQQLDDHYFGPVSERVLAFMQELDYEMYRLGIPSKTRHNEVAPGQFEVAPIFKSANISNDQNLLLMHLMDKIATRHDFVVLLHEKPFAGINGSGKHMNWSLSDNTGANLLEPGLEPQSNHNFLLMVAIIVKAVEKHAKMIRMSVATAGNDHRLGANEAPPSIISVFLGETLDRIYRAILDGVEFEKMESVLLDFNANQLVSLLKDNTDRNRTSPFAFTGNKFEVRAVGSAQAVGFPATILNTAVADILRDVNASIEKKVSAGNDINQVKNEMIRELLESSYHVVFNGDGYSDQWVKEAQKRGLPNLRTTAEAVTAFADKNCSQFLIDFNIFSEREVNARYNVLVEHYCTQREIEFRSLANIIDQYVVPSAVKYKTSLLDVMVQEKQLDIEHGVEQQIVATLSKSLEKIQKSKQKLIKESEKEYKSEAEKALVIANKLLPLSEEIAKECNTIESLVADDLWALPKYYDMLFIR
jgi:glutamine synthetase